MKLDKIKFARVVSFLANRLSMPYFNDEFLTDLDNIIDVDVPEQDVVQVYPSNKQVDDLMRLMVQGTQKIEAIKVHRMITGMGLKESKDAVERYWPTSKGYQKSDLYNAVDTSLSDNEQYVIKRFVDGLK